MDIERKRTIFFGSILALAIIGAIVLFFWGNVIDRGTLKFTGEAPFSVEVYGLLKQDCPTSPCLVKTKSGYKDLAIHKEGFRSIITSSTVKLWRTVAIPLTFDIIPQVEATDAIPDPQKKLEFDLVMDKGNNMQKLINKSNSSSEALVYFPKPIPKFSIFGDKNAALILDLSSIDNPAYIVNFETKKREQMSQANLLNIVDGRWSDDGKFLVFSKKNSSSIWLLDATTKNISQLALNTGIKQTSWSYNDNLVFVSAQSYSSVSENEINLLPSLSQTGLTFGIYNAKINKSELIGDFAEIQVLPDELISTSNGNTIYFQSDKKNFKITLRKV